MNKIIKYFYFFLISLLLFGCASDGWYAQQAREKFIRLSPEEREKEIEFCVSHYKKMIDQIPNQKKICNSWSCTLGKEDYKERMQRCILGEELTSEEQERLKNKDSWSYKLRSWYYGIW